ncbi:MAG: threonine--tRNA ligase [Desulfovibrionaceae bacterium]|nr:threonine--tRNA ligase [Desulfovibrionaceae bacterium]
MQVLVEGREERIPEGTSCAETLKTTLSGKKFKSVLACKVDGLLVDLSFPLKPGVRELEPVYADSPEGLDILRHSTAHLMAAAVKELFPEARVAIGPSIENGFYYDFDYSRPFSTEDFAAIEERMRALAAKALPFTRCDITKAEAVARFSGEQERYKCALLDDLAEERVSLYQLGEFVDLCRGPHVPHTGFLSAFTLLSTAGAYWRGSEKNAMLSRIYGTAFSNEKALKDYLHRLEEAKRRDHRKIGKELDFFAFHEEAAPGMVFWHPKGMLARTILEDFWRKEHLRRGYDIVQGPQLLRRELWERSGHYDNYRENMYFTAIKQDDETKDAEMHGIKPMNCLAHMLIYKSRLRSYRELPQRYFELGVVHRHEKSGVLHGLLRVRQFTQDDAHIICTPDQLEDEMIGVIALVRDLMHLFDFSYKVAIATRPEKRIGSDEDWERATRALIQAAERAGVSYSIHEGDGAFYGPKIDVRLLDCLGREWQCSTIQCDFTLPERFDLVYVGADGARYRPVMVHRAIMGSLERFIGVLLEHYAGALPTWLHPVQARLLNVTDAQLPCVQEAGKRLFEAGFRAEADVRNEKLGFKVREAQVQKIPYILVIGDKEAEVGGVNIRLRSGENVGLRSLPELIEMMRADCREPFKRGGMRYNFVYNE